jgi:predicted transcriptional regulator
VNDIIALTAEIVANFVTGNKIGAAELPTLIHSVYSTLANIDAPAVEASAETAKATPAQVRKSLGENYLISFEDGKPYKTLKRHLAKRGLTPDGYRAKWGLPKDYPMVARSYSLARSKMAMEIGLGQKGRAAKDEAPVAKPVKRGAKKVAAE